MMYYYETGSSYEKDESLGLRPEERFFLNKVLPANTLKKRGGELI